MTRLTSMWLPSGLLALGAIGVTLGVKTQRSLELRESLGAAIPAQIEGLASRDLVLADAELAVSGVTSYLMREYGDSNVRDSAGLAGFTLYVGYYSQQSQGRTIHSPKNCLPGAGWEALTSSVATVATASGDVTVNQYLIQNGRSRALVFYWYQGRGRVVANEYAVKWNLLRDAALLRRSDEALVRVVIPVSGSEGDAEALATRLTRQIVPAVKVALPA